MSDPHIWLPTDAGFDDAVANTIFPEKQQVLNKELLLWGIAIACSGFLIALLNFSLGLGIIAMLAGLVCMAPSLNVAMRREEQKSVARDARKHTLPLLEKKPSEAKPIDESGAWSVTKQITYTEIEHLDVTNGTGRHLGSAIINVRWRGRDDIPPVLYLIKDSGVSFETDVNKLRQRSTASVIAERRHSEPIEDLEDTMVQDGKTYYYYALVTIPIEDQQLLIRRRVYTHVARKSESLEDLKDLENQATTAEQRRAIQKRIDKLEEEENPKAKPSMGIKVAEELLRELGRMREEQDAEKIINEVINKVAKNDDERDRLMTVAGIKVVQEKRAMQKKKP